MTTIVSQAVIEELAPAKINLFLHIVAKRLDDYHEIQSLAVFPQLQDRIEVSAGKRLNLKITGPFADQLTAESPTADNLVIRAARALQDHLGEKLGAKITLHKNLPIASGLGGGSADAAATLKALMGLWAVKPNLNAVKRTARSLGADVPVCLSSRPALMGGIGTRITLPPPLPQLAFVLINSGTPVSTEEAYRRLNWKQAVRKGPVAVPDHFEDTADLITFLKKCRNDLQGPALDIAPEIGKVLSVLSSLRGCRLARMSGSGATCFGLFANMHSAEKAAELIAAAHPKWWVSVTNT